MSGTQLVEEHKHPEGVTLTQALREDSDRSKAVVKSGIRKVQTLVKAPDTPMPEGIGATMVPTDEQLGRINQFTKKRVTAEEVVAFPTLSCNDIEDRDEDRFTTDCVKQFATLTGPFSSVGKSYMVDHAYRMENAQGRIFGVSTQKVGDALFLTNEVYIPKTERHMGLIEDIDFGIAWAVSVGVVLGKQTCSVCDAGFSSWGYWCSNGHDKGMYYLKDSEQDQWGFPLPVDSRTNGAIKCIRNFAEPRDFYELSQVFLGAQYDAQIGQTLVAAAKSAGTSLLGVSAEEAKSLRLPHEPERLTVARLAGAAIEEGEDGVLAWKDDSGFQWVFNPADPKSGVMGLGKSTKEVTDDGEGTIEDDQLPAGSPGEGGLAEGEPGDLTGDDNGSKDPTQADGTVEGGPAGEVAAGADDEDDEEDPEEDDDSEDSETSDEDEEKDVSREAVLAAARKAKLPKDVVSAAETSEGNGLTALLLSAGRRLRESTKEAESLRPRAALGDQYMKALKDEALALFIKANQEGDEPVATATFEKLLERCGDDIELVTALIDQHTTAIQKKFGKPVVRSSFPTDVHDRSEPEAPGVDPSSAKVSRLHG